MSIEAVCPNCEKSYVVGDDKAGRRFRCQDCGVPVPVPRDDIDDFGFADGDQLESGSQSGTGPVGGTWSPEVPQKKSSGQIRIGTIVLTVLGTIIVAVLVVAFFLYRQGERGRKEEENIAKAEEPINHRFRDPQENVEDFAEIPDPGFDENGRPLNLGPGNQNRGGFAPENVIPGGFDPQNRVEPRRNPTVLNMPKSIPEIPSRELPAQQELQTHFMELTAGVAIHTSPARGFASPYGAELPLALFTQLDPEINWAKIEQFTFALTIPLPPLQAVEGNGEALGTIARDWDVELLLTSLLNFSSVYLRATEDFENPEAVIQMLAKANQSRGTPAGYQLTIDVKVIEIQEKPCFLVNRTLTRAGGVQPGQPEPLQVTHSQVLYMPNRREVVMTSRAVLENMLSDAPQTGPLARRLKQVPVETEFAVVFTQEENIELRSVLASLAKEKLRGKLEPLATLPLDVDSLSLVVDLNDPDLLRLKTESSTEEAAVRVEKVLPQLKGIATVGYGLLKFQLGREASRSPAIPKLLKIGDDVLNGTVISRQDKTATLTVPQPEGLKKLLPQLLEDLE